MSTPKRKPALKDRLSDSFADGYTDGFNDGRRAAERVHLTILDEERKQIRAELSRDLKLARFETVTKGMQMMFSAFGQAIGELRSLDQRIA